MRRLAVVLCFVLLLPAPTRGQENRPATLKNADEIRRKMMEEYPLEMRRRGVSGRSVVEMMVRDNGKPAQIRLSQRSGSTALDHAALDLARDMRFDPARSGGEKVDQKVRLPLAFESSCGLAPERTKQPETTELLDGLDIVAIQQLSMSPPGAVLVDVHVDTAGRPTEVGVLQSSGVVDADSLAVRTIRNSRYEPL
ncbi:MAG: TonB family protein, partial [Gemmatimonadales bacterium]